MQRATSTTASANSSHGTGSTFRHYFPLAVGLCLALLPVEQAWFIILPELPWVMARLTGLSAASAHGLADIISYSLDSLLLMTLVRYWERLQWDSVGVKMISARDLFIALALWFIDLRTKTFFAQMRWFAPPPPPSGSVPLVLGRGLGFAYILAAVAVEELGSRAYVIERFITLTGSIWIAGGISWLASIMLHVPAWGAEGALARAPVLLVLVLLYLWRRNLPLCVLVHVLVNTHHSIVMSLLKLPEPIRGWVLYPIGFILRL